MNWGTLKEHAVKFCIGLLAAMGMAALQAAIHYVSGIDWNAHAAFLMQALTAYGVIHMHSVVVV